MIAYLAGRVWRGGLRRWMSIIVLAVALLYTWARFVEPQLILVHEHRAAVGFPARIALVADLHMGVYKGTWFLTRLVDRLNALQVDMVLIGGDLVESPDRPLRELLAPLSELRHPAYAVRGNHDTRDSDSPSEKDLRAALAALHVTLMENESRRVGRFMLVGLGDYSSHNDRTDMLGAFRPSDNVVVLTHNPDTAPDLPPGIADLTLAAHTHGGQVRIPWLYRQVIPTRGNFDRGWYSLSSTRLFITSGVGENALPVRFLVPPVIDVIVLE